MIEQARDERLDLNDVFGFVGTFEERLDDISVLGVRGRIDFDGKLPDATDVFLGRDGHAARGVGAEGGGVAGSFAEVFMPENKGDVFAVHVWPEDAGLLARF